MSWKSLAFLLIDLAPTLEKSKEVIETLVHELELWVSKVESYQNKAIEISTDIHLETKVVENSEKSELEDESIVSDAESAYDFQFHDSRFEEKLINSDEYRNLSSEKNLESDKNDCESDKELAHENNQQDLHESPETKLDLLASRFYEFIGDSDDVAKDTNEVLSVDIEEKVKDTSNSISNHEMENEHCNEVIMENKNLNDNAVKQVNLDL